MNYKKIYNDLIKRGINRDRTPAEYYEKHHIIPRCLGGDNVTSNISVLTCREHFLAHQLLTKIYPDNRRLTYAFLCMIRDPHGKRTIKSKYYEFIKRAMANMQRAVFINNNPMRESNAKLQHSLRMKSNNPQHTHPDRCRRFTESPSKGKVAYNNGIKNKYFEEGSQPTGWVVGLLPYKRNWNGGRKKG